MQSYEINKKNNHKLCHSDLPRKSFTKKKVYLKSQDHLKNIFSLCFSELERQ